MNINQIKNGDTLRTKDNRKVVVIGFDRKDSGREIVMVKDAGVELPEGMFEYEYPEYLRK